MVATSGDELHQIGAVAERVGLSLRTIRHYDEVGVVTPSGRSKGGFRLYTDDDIERLRVAKAMKPLGFTLEETKDLMALRDRLDRGGHLDSGALSVLRTYSNRASARCERLDRELHEARALADMIRGDVEVAVARRDPTPAGQGTTWP